MHARIHGHTHASAYACVGVRMYACVLQLLQYLRGMSAWTGCLMSTRATYLAYATLLLPITAHCLQLPTPAYSLLPTPYSLLPTPYSLLPTPYCPLPTPYFLLPPAPRLACAFLRDRLRLLAAKMVLRACWSESRTGRRVHVLRPSNFCSGMHMHSRIHMRTHVYAYSPPPRIGGQLGAESVMHARTLRTCMHARMRACMHAYTHTSLTSWVRTPSSSRRSPVSSTSSPPSPRYS